MLKIVIVEDDKEYVEKYETIINDILFKSNREYEIFKFTKYTPELKSIIKDTSEQKIYIIDLELENKYSGMDILREIREEDWDSEILVVTNHDRMFETVHKEIYKTFDFIEKFCDLDKKLGKDLKLIFNRKYDVGKLIYSNKRISLQIYYKDIIYIYRDTVDRKTVIKTTNNEFYLNIPLLEIMDMLDDRFEQCSKSCILNKDRINERNYGQGYFITDRGETVNMLSKKYKCEVE